MMATNPLLNTLQKLPSQSFVFQHCLWDLLTQGCVKQLRLLYSFPLTLFLGVPSVQGSPDGHSQFEDHPTGKAQGSSHPAGRVGPHAKTQATRVRL